MQLEPPSADVQRVAQAVRGYLRQHPQAADTAAGIQRWWLLPTVGEVSLSTVEAALVQLQAEGSVVCVAGCWHAAGWAARSGAGGRPASAPGPH